MSEFEGRISFVTGAGSGIGQAMALKLATEGSTVVCSDINEQTAQATAARAKEAGAKAVANALDTADEDAVKDALTKTQRDLDSKRACSASPRCRSETACRRTHLGGAGRASCPLA